MQLLQLLTSSCMTASDHAEAHERQTKHASRLLGWLQSGKHTFLMRPQSPLLMQDDCQVCGHAGLYHRHLDPGRHDSDILSCAMVSADHQPHPMKQLKSCITCWNSKESRLPERSTFVGTDPTPAPAAKRAPSHPLEPASPTSGTSSEGSGPDLQPEQAPVSQASQQAVFPLAWEAGQGLPAWQAFAASSPPKEAAVGPRAEADAELAGDLQRLQLQRRLSQRGCAPEGLPCPHDLHRSWPGCKGTHS